jgi:hypothetical protein
VFWRKLFGRKYPRTHKRFWRPPETEPWFRKPVVPAEARSPYHPGRRPPKRPDDRPTPPDDGPPPPPDSGTSPPPDSPPPSPGGATPPSPERRPGPSHPGPYRPGERPSRRPRLHDTERRPRRVPAEPAASYWTKVFGSAGGAASVPLTFG